MMKVIIYKPCFGRVTRGVTKAQLCLCMAQSPNLLICHKADHIIFEPRSEMVSDQVPHKPGCTAIEYG